MWRDILRRIFFTNNRIEVGKMLLNKTGGPITFINLAFRFSPHKAFKRKTYKFNYNGEIIQKLINQLAEQNLGEGDIGLLYCKCLVKIKISMNVFMKRLVVNTIAIFIVSLLA